ncbi:MAG: type I CRISPR-associated protein Cas7 [Rivularia sp. (in: cyanobacteria)]
MDVFASLKAFRQAVYENLCRAHDATFELTDAVMLTRQAYCLADLSQCPIFRRKWSSIYEALQDTRPQRQKLMKLYIKQMPTSGQIILARDHTAWSRPNAVTLKDRTMEHHCNSGIAANKPITSGQCYSTIAWIPESETKDNKTMGRKAVLPYGLYKTHVFFNPHLAKQTGVTENDLRLFWQALMSCWETDRSAFSNS